MDIYEAIEKNIKTGVWTFDEYVKFLDEISGDSDVGLNMNLTNYGNTFVLTLTDDNENENRIFYSTIEAENLTMDKFSGLYATVVSKYIYTKIEEAEKEEKEKCSLVKPGDKVVCVKAHKCFTQGKVYEVVDLFDDDDDDENCRNGVFCIIRDDEFDDRKIYVSKEQVISNYWFMPLKEN